MFRRLTLAGLMALSLLTIPVAAGPVTAASHPQPVAIVSHMTMVDEGFNYGDFRVAVGHTICRSGQVNDTLADWVWTKDLPNGDGEGELTVEKTFTCNRGDEIFFRLDVLVYVHFDAQGTITWHEKFTWVVLGGTGAYAHLRGQGRGLTDATKWPESMVNYYFGTLQG